MTIVELGGFRTAWVGSSIHRSTRSNLTAPLFYLLTISISAILDLFLLVPEYYILPGWIDAYWAKRPTHKGRRGSK